MIINYITKGFVARAGVKNLTRFAMQGNLRRSIHHTEGQLIEEAPAQVKLGLIKVCAIVLPFGYLGAILSKRGAEFLEEWNIFVPEDDDD